MYLSQIKTPLAKLNVLWHAEMFPGLPPPEDFLGETDTSKPADIVFVYDFACGAYSSIKARMRQMKEKKEEVPEEVKCWTKSSKWLVDKFHFQSHVGTVPIWVTECHLDILVGLFVEC